MSLALAGKTEAFGELVRRYESAVIGAAARILRDAHAAEDTAQDTFLEAFEKLSNLREPDSAGAWLVGIARRKALRMRPRLYEFDDLADYADILPDIPPGQSSAPEARVFAAELRREIVASFDALTERNRAVAKLYFLAGLTTPEIARRLNIPIGTVTYRLSQARAKLKGDLSEMTDIKKDDGFVKAVMEKVEKLKTYYYDHNYSTAGIKDALRETETLIRKLPDGAEKVSASAALEYHRYFDDDQTEERLLRALEAAKKAGDADSVADIYIEKFSKLTNQDRIGRARQSLDFLLNEALPAVGAMKSENAVGVIKFWIATVYIDLNDLDTAEREFAEASRMLRRENVYYANALAALRGIALAREHCDESFGGALPGATILAEGVRLKDGALRFVNQPGFGTTLPPAGLSIMSTYVGYLASRFDEGWFYDLSMKDGETRADRNGAVMTLVSRDEEVSVPAGSFGKCLHIAVCFPDVGNGVRECADYDAWYAPNVGLVKLHMRDAANDETYELDEYAAKSARGGEDDYFPLAEGNRWSYVNRALPDYVYQRNERVIEYTDGELANFSVVQLYALKKGILENLELDSALCLELASQLSQEWEKLDDALETLRRAVRLNTNRADVDVALRAIEYLARTREYYKLGYRFCPSGFGSGYITAKDGAAVYDEWGQYRDFGPYRFGSRFEENRIFGLKPLRYLQELTRCVWNDRWVPGYSEVLTREEGAVFITAEDAGEITVPAGTFPNCLKLTMRLERDTENDAYYFDGYRYVHCGEKTVWFAPGVGVVRFDCAWGDKLSSRCELTSYLNPAGGEDYFPVSIGCRWEYDEINLAAEGYSAKRKAEITGGALGKYTLCESQEFVYLGTEAQYEEFKAGLPKSS
ncbi:MAG: sigma-70 family RNA polymerase sigma factor [Oscillospiraceae bacterium]|nr:sigma-70 family RNA polymerase sigma factor [Oscillospiraceae bacterium]